MSGKHGSEEGGAGKRRPLSDTEIDDAADQLAAAAIRLGRTAWPGSAAHRVSGLGGLDGAVHGPADPLRGLAVHGAIQAAQAADPVSR